MEEIDTLVHHVLEWDMTTTVSYSEFRKNLSKYIDLLHKDGAKVSLEDARTGKKLITLGKVDDKADFDWDEYMKLLENIKGSGLLASKEDEELRIKFRKEINKRFDEAYEI